MNRRLFLVTTGSLAAAAMPQLGAESAEAPAAGRPARLKQIARAQAQILPLHQKKRPSQPGDWLKSHKEEGQTFQQFLAGHKQPVHQKYPRLYVQPLGEFSKSQGAAVDLTVEFMGHFFGMPVKALPAVSLSGLPRKARRVHPEWEVPQVLSTHLLDQVLKPIRPRDAAALLGLTAEDLWPGEGWNFVFGQASLSDRVGVWSLHRNGNPEGSADERRLFLRRTLKTAVHETGHMFGIKHCIAFECCMNGGNSLTESDRQPLEYCPQCQAKLWWTCGATGAERYQRLGDFAREHSLSEEAEFWDRSHAALNG